MPTIDAYGKLTRYPTLYGQGLTLLMLSEYIHQHAERKATTLVPHPLFASAFVLMTSAVCQPTNSLHELQRTRWFAHNLQSAKRLQESR